MRRTDEEYLVFGFRKEGLVYEIVTPAVRLVAAKWGWG